MIPENSGFFVGWGTLSLINAGLAQSKGRSGLLWWLGLPSIFRNLSWPWYNLS